MAIFPEDLYHLHNRLDWKILQNGWSSLYSQSDILEKDLEWFANNGFKIININCTGWDSKKAMHDSLKRAMSFPDYYGEDLDALNDCLSDLEISGDGLIVTFRHFDVVETAIGQQVVDIFANNSWHHILSGMIETFVVLIQLFKD